MVASAGHVDFVPAQVVKGVRPPGAMAIVVNAIDACGLKTDPNNLAVVSPKMDIGVLHAYDGTVTTDRPVPVQRVASVSTLFLSFPYVCPEPVLVKSSVLYINGSERKISHPAAPPLPIDLATLPPRHAMLHHATSSKFGCGRTRMRHLTVTLGVLGRNGWRIARAWPIIAYGWA
jgi:hypothetical protein